jgi:hypothetical protein
MFETKNVVEPEVTHKKKDFFDELWEKEHPEEAA